MHARAEPRRSMPAPILTPHSLSDLIGEVFLFFLFLFGQSIHEMSLKRILAVECIK